MELDADYAHEVYLVCERKQQLHTAMSFAEDIIKRHEAKLKAAAKAKAASAKGSSVEFFNDEFGCVWPAFRPDETVI